MKKLICSDIDGTLLQEDGTRLPEELFAQILRLEKLGYLFCPASGRQYTSMRKLFAPVAEHLLYLCENGAALFDGSSTLLGKTVMPRDRAEALCRDILSIDCCEVLISGEDMSYVIPKEVDMVRLMEESKGNHVTVVSDPSEVPEDIIKIAAYSRTGFASIPSRLAECWPEFNPAVAGKWWMDFMLANKGTGLRQLCDALHISSADVIAFGDNFNDAPMLAQAGTPYIMATAAPALLERFPNHCTDVTEVLKQLA